MQPATIERVQDGLYQCEHEGCGERRGLTERKYSDEDGEMYYNILCLPHRAEEENTSRCCGEEIVFGYCNGCGEHA